jgi:hypothetical protein
VILFRYLRPAVLWVMIPLTVVAGRPATGCTCADGHYKPICFAQFHGNIGSGTHGAKKQPCHKACCEGCHAGSGVPGCCKQGLCPSSHANSQSRGKKCCSPDLPTAVAVAKSVSFAVDLDHHLLFDSPRSRSVNVIVHASTVEHFTPFETGPPDDDLVVTLHRLLI